MTESPQLEFSYSEPSYDRSTRDFSVTVNVTNTGAAVGRDVSLVLTGLPDSASVLNASGMIENSRPYLNFGEAIPLSPLEVFRQMLRARWALRGYPARHESSNDVWRLAIHQAAVLATHQEAKHLLFLPVFRKLQGGRVEYFFDRDSVFCQALVLKVTHHQLEFLTIRFNAVGPEVISHQFFRIFQLLI